MLTVLVLPHGTVYPENHRYFRRPITITMTDISKKRIRLNRTMVLSAELDCIRTVPEHIYFFVGLMESID